MNFYKKMRSKTTLSPLEVVEKMKEVAPLLNENLDVNKYLQCEKGFRKMKGERLNSFLEVINNAKENPTEQTIENLNLERWFEEFKKDYKSKFAEFNIQSQKQLAKLIGISQPTLSEMFTGRKPINKNNIRKLKKFFEDDLNIQEEAKQDDRGKYTRLESSARNKRVYISDEEYEKLRKKFIEKFNKSGMSCCQLGRNLKIDNTTIGKVVRGTYVSRGSKIIEAMKKFVNENTGEPIEVTKDYVFNEEQIANWEKAVEYIKYLRDKKGYSLRDIAKESDISDSSLCQILSGKYEMSLPMLVRLTKFYKKYQDEIKEETIEPSNEEVVEEINEEVTENATEETSEENKDEKSKVCGFVVTNAEQFVNIVKKYNELLTKYNKEHEILQNYETLIKVIKSFQQ